MTSTSVTACKLLKDALNDSVDNFSQRFEAVRGHNPQDEASKITDCIRAIIAPGPIETEVNSRRSTLSHPTIYLCILSRLNGCTSTDDVGDLTQLDELIGFVEEMHRFFVTESGDVLCLDKWEAMSVTSDPVYDTDALAKGIFQSVLRIDFESTEGDS